MINLLPHKEKKEILLEETKRIIISLGFFTFLSFFSLVLILLSAKIYLSGEITAQKIFLKFEKESLAAKEMSNIQRQVQIFNEKLSLLDTFVDQKTNIAPVLDKVIPTIPPGIYLTNFAYSKKTSQISISGFSPTRDILFQFKKNLEQEFQNVIFPADSWVKAADINFQGVTF